MADFDPKDDPAVRCEHPGLVRQILSPYPISVEHRDDAVVIRYEEWAIERPIYLAAEAPLDEGASSMGFSTGRFADSALVVETAGATRGLNMMPQFFWTSEEASVVERYSLSERGQLVMELELTDPVMLSEPWRVKKTWNPYTEALLDFDCTLRERP